MNPRIVCAAIQNADGVVICSPRHYDETMHKIIEQIDECLMSSFYDSSTVIQGFVDQFGNFYNRRDAYKIAKENNQIIRDHHIVGELFSEHLY